MTDLATIRRMLGKDAFRSLVEQDAANPERAQTYKDIQRALNRAKIPENVKWNLGKPTLPDQAGSIFDFNNIGEYPYAHLAPFDQATSMRGVSSNLKPALSARSLQEMLQDAKSGSKAGRWAWYDMSPIHDFVRNEIDPADAQYAQQFMKLGVPMSQQTSVPAEILASAYLNKIGRHEGIEGLTPNDDTLGITRFGGGASPADKILRAKRMLEGHQLPPTSPKLAAYQQNREGNLFPATVDSKMLDAVGMEGGEKPAAKGDVAALLKSFGARTGMETAKLQASLWGKGQGFKVTGDASEPYAAVLNNMLFRAAQKEGIDPKRYAVEVLSGMRDMPHTAKGLGYAGGGSVRGALSALADRMEMSLLVGNNETASRRLVDRPDAMRAYLARTAPQEWRDSLMSARSPADQMGSGREILFADVPGSRGREQAVVKLAKRGRGTAENLVASSPENQGLVKSGNLPQPYYTAPGGDFVISPKMRTDPFAVQSHAKFMKPMVKRYQDLNALGTRIDPGAAYFNLHDYDDELTEMLAKRGMSGFSGRGLLGHDFWTYKGNKIHPGGFGDSFVDDRVQSTLSHPSMGKGFVLLDEGALLPHLLPMDRAKAFEPGFGEITKRRIDTLRDPETADLMGRRGPQERLPGVESKKDYADRIGLQSIFDQAEAARGSGMYQGGHMKRARQALAAGGQPRNWLRGVNGSQLDSVLARLKGKTIDTDADVLARAKDSNYKNAMEKWIDTNLANYIVREHGTPNDPLNKQNLLPHPAAVRKIAAADVPDVLNKDLAGWRGEGATAATADLRRRQIAEFPTWLQKAIEQDTPRKWSKDQFGKAAMEKAGMNPSDKVSDIPESSIDALSEMRTVKEKLPDAHEKYQRRHAEPIHLHDIDRSTWDRYYDAPMNDTLDYLRQAYTPQELSRVGVPDAVRKSQEWHAAMQKKAEQATALKMAGQSAYKTYPEGWKWLELATQPTQGAGAVGSREANEATEQVAQQIGKQLGHCYQHPETCKDYLHGGSKLYSLIDPKGKAYATLESRMPSQSLSGDLLMHEFGDRGRDAWKAHLAGGSRDMHGEIKKNYPDIWEKLQERWGQQELSQIRGPQFPPYNAKVQPEAQKYVHDFIRSGKWGDLDQNELRNAGLDFGPAGNHPQLGVMNRKLRELYGEQVGYSQEELDNAAKLSGSENFWHGRNLKKYGGEYAKGGSVHENRKGNPLGRARAAFYETGGGREDATAATRDRDFRWSHLQKQADGGAVSPSGFPAETSDERLYRAVLSLHVLQREYIDDPNPTLAREIARTEALIRKLQSPDAALAKQTEDVRMDTGGMDSTMASSLANEATQDTGGEEDETLAYLLKLLQDDNPEGITP